MRTVKPDEDELDLDAAAVAERRRRQWDEVCERLSEQRRGQVLAHFAFAFLDSALALLVEGLVERGVAVRVERQGNTLRLELYPRVAVVKLDLAKDHVNFLVGDVYAGGLRPRVTFEWPVPPLKHPDGVPDAAATYAKALKDYIVHGTLPSVPEK